MNTLSDSKNYISQTDIANITEWDQIKGLYPISMSNLGNVQGVLDESEEVNDETVYGAELMKVSNMHTPYFETMVTRKVQVPWLAEPAEATFNNRVKILNEPPVKEYADIRLSSIDPNYWFIETFDSVNDTSYKLFFAIILFLVIVYLLKNN